MSGPDLRILAQELVELRQVAIASLRRDLLMPYEVPDGEWLAAAVRHCDDKWPAVAAVIAEYGAQEVCS